MKNIGKVMSFLVCALAVFICIVMIVMNFTDGDGDISNIVWTEEMLEEYNKAPDSFYVEYISAYEERYFTEDGYFSVSEGRWIPSCSQWQFTVRYNKSTLEEFSEERGREFAEDKDHFTFALVASDGTVYRDFSYIRDAKGRYTYYRLVFDDVDISDIGDIQIMIYCLEDMESEELPGVAVGKLPLYYSELTREDYDFESELPEDMKPTEGLVSGNQLLKGYVK